MEISIFLELTVTRFGDATWKMHSVRAHSYRYVMNDSTFETLPGPHFLGSDEPPWSQVPVIVVLILTISRLLLVALDEHS